MTVTTENSIRALLSNTEEVMLGELSLIKHSLEKLFESDEARIPKEESFKYLLKIVEVSERIRAAKYPRQKSDIYYSEYRPFFSELKAKYSEFLARDTFKEIEAHEKYMDGFRELIIALGIMLFAFEEIDRVRQYGALYTGMVGLSELLEEYLLYFPQDLIEYLKNITLAFLNDSSLKPDKANQKESVFSYLVGLKNTARAVLWQIEENRTRSEKQPSIDSHSNQIFTRELQIQKNQAAIDWANSRLEQIETISEAKGWKL
ncbi:hypothetical protein Osc7112_1360 [Oscillatoria nigro-viridis PCC 7112]|uniref:Uncharacterized protein n=1 Tax=Phormidium nigroviride PCC 7112 TaxID=179408 RepID=K9VD82_9CYAN|nr:hypothetical protein [Oscillatoria nigro-viridis]AFZ05891.1 hypothetical protein Osc7112_1360 [Oscillatoria nigro-viridis PCC 7112]